MKMKGAKAVHYESGPNMTPLVDVVMVILIFLMLAGQFGGAEHFLASNVPMNGGPGSVKTPAEIDEPIEIRVDSPSPDRFTAVAGRISAKDGPTLPVALNRLREDLNKAGRKTPDIQIKIAPGHNVKIDHIVAVQEAAMRAQFEKIGYAKAH